MKTLILAGLASLAALSAALPAAAAPYGHDHYVAHGHYGAFHGGYRHAYWGYDRFHHRHRYWR